MIRHENYEQLLAIGPVFQQLIIVGIFYFVGRWWEWVAG